MRMHRHLAALVLFACLFCLPGIVGSLAAQNLTEARVIAVNDGDTVTLRLSGKEYRTRLIGLDAPEMGQEPWGRRSHEHLRKMLKEARWRVSVETDVVQFDKYDRILVYLWNSAGEMLNERMLRDGYAVLFTIQPNSRYVERLRSAQRAAREEKKGVWGPDGLKERPLDYKKAHPRRENSRHQAR